MTNFTPSENTVHFHSSLGNGADAFTRSLLLKRLLREAEKPCLTRQQWDTMDRHIAELRQLIYRQVQLVEKNKLKSVERVAMLNDLMANYQKLRRK